MNETHWDIVRAAFAVILLLSVVLCIVYDKQIGELLVALGIVTRSLFPTQSVREVKGVQ